jgi:hypothetical protein
MMAAGAEADTASILALAEDDDWVKVELFVFLRRLFLARSHPHDRFKLRLRPRSMKLDLNGMRLSRLPQGKSATQVFGDFLSYLYLCTRSFIRDTHANGTALWAAVEKDVQFVLCHPNGWQGSEQAKIRQVYLSLAHYHSTYPC